MTEANARVSYVAAQPVTLAAADLVALLAGRKGMVTPSGYERLLGQFKLAARDELGVNPAEAALVGVQRS